MKLLSTSRRGGLVFRTYRHPTRGHLRTVFVSQGKERAVIIVAFNQEGYSAKARPKREAP